MRSLLLVFPLWEAERLLLLFALLRCTDEDLLDILAEEPGADLREITLERLLEGLDDVLPETVERDLLVTLEFLLTVADGFLFTAVPELRDIRLVLLAERLE